MLLIVGGPEVSTERLTSLLGPYDLERATTIAEARERCRLIQPDALVLGRDPTVPPTEGFLGAVRAGAFGRADLPVVAVTPDGSTGQVDEPVVPPVSGESLKGAVDRALVLGEYQSAIVDFFDVCRERAEGGGPSPADFRTARTEADAALAAIRGRKDRLPLDRLLDDS